MPCIAVRTVSIRPAGSTAVRTSTATDRGSFRSMRNSVGGAGSRRLSYLVSRTTPMISVSPASSG